MTAYRVQYWIYAIIVKHFGKEPFIDRDCLHRRYSVNRHSFSVEGIPFISLLEVLKTHLSCYNQSIDYGWTFSKTLENGKTVSIHIRQEPHCTSFTRIHISVRK